MPLPNGRSHRGLPNTCRSRERTPTGVPETRKEPVMEVTEIQIHKVFEGYHPRKDVKGLQELKEQIQKYGPEPIRVRPQEGHFVVIDGKRRLDSE
jgi:hypothetical protein